ncbi:unnamed protein product [Rotaria socialis]|uniref:Cyclin-like domain-containing protein n=1 Tax=Rotaria socialis TaxID=392032 RepID=A0A821LYK2_9BILA|nr:unnamed protein product [Rotaria socialis]CAF4758821.1 unnamed protein product [Rotaria socialis]
MPDNSDGGSPSQVRAPKRSRSPDHSPILERKSKVAKFELQQDNAGQDISNKENHTNHKQSEMIMVKHSLSTCNIEEDDQDDGIIIDHLDLSSLPYPWYRSNSLWSNMMAKTFDETYKCHSNFLNAHPAITIKMRSVLCDWIIEVSEVYHLHRETYHLAIAYIDQYLCNTSNLPKAKLQLLGITALFIAAKIEEIYPPRISEFAYVTDKAYYEGDILDMELDILNALNWYINPMTSTSWLLAFLQVESEIELMNNSLQSSISSTNVTPSHYDRCIKKRRLSLLNTQKPSSSSSDSEFLKTSMLTSVHRTPMFLQTFSLAVRLLDFCSLDIEYSQFPKNVIAATAILACKPNWPVEQITSLNDDDLYICHEWMKPFFDVLYFGQSLTSIPVPASRSSPAIPIDEIYSIQIHNISLDLLENVYKKRPNFIPPTTNNRPFRNLVNRLSWLPTPPTSLEKQHHEIIVNEEEQLQIAEVVSV